MINLKHPLKKYIWYKQNNKHLGSTIWHQQVYAQREYKIKDAKVIVVYSHFLEKTFYIAANVEIQNAELKFQPP